MKPIPYGRQSITEADIEAVVDVLKSDFMTQGPKIAEFERAFAHYVGSTYAVAVSNGTAALHLAALALDVDASTNVITTPITFAASANAIRYCGGEIFFADIDPETYLLSLNSVKQLLERHPKGFFKGIIPVDFTGAPVNTQEFKALAQEYNLWIIEDGCHAPGAYFHDINGNKQMVGNGNFADLTIFSFHPVKHIATGEGGMITTNNKALYDKLMVLRTHGITKNVQAYKNSPEEIAQGGWYYEMQELGFNYRLTDLQAALGISQLKRANEGLKRRKEIAENYTKAFAGSRIVCPRQVEGNAWHLYVIQVDDREGLYEHLKTNNIFAQVHYVPVHLMPYYKKRGSKKGDCPHAEAYYEKCLSLPMYPGLTETQQAYVIDKIKTFFA
ncbi:MAG TPA: UDP-4-amino-4,6-dideoxy-N-acetyl-beta-L-altrosamine transaminase [Flavobacteriales bacterium]|nr:UDP-4-amino-4,6-dideoxy-N-acetyl-beta-L-altrosamine transaminase [Flavobacteriales bacterium]